jgi:hypothetical protein
MKTCPPSGAGAILFGCRRSSSPPTWWPGCAGGAGRFTRRSRWGAAARAATWSRCAASASGPSSARPASGWRCSSRRTSGCHTRTGYRSRPGARATPSPPACCATTGSAGWRLVAPAGVRPAVAPAERSRISDRLIGSLAAEQRTFAPAGNARARFWSPWKATVAEIQTWSAANPSAPFAELVRSIRHHYRTAATARSCLRRHIEEGLVPGVRLDREGGRLWISLVEPGSR